MEKQHKVVLKVPVNVNITESGVGWHVYPLAFNGNGYMQPRVCINRVMQ